MTESHQQLLVHRMTWEARDVLSLELVDPAGGALPEWEPGAHLDVGLGDGMRRQYSLCGDPGDRTRFRVAVRREEAGRGGSRRVHEQLRPGDFVDVRGPRNHFRLEKANGYLFLAGGIGITPILPMVAAAEAAGRPWRLVYRGRDRASMPFAGELGRYGKRVSLLPGDESDRPDVSGLVTELVTGLGTGGLVYCCGPAPLLDEAAACCPAEYLRVERFAAPEQVDFPSGAFEVRLATTGRTVTVPAERSVLDVLLDEGCDVPNDCREGICGSCETKVLDGSVEHRDHVLTEKERRSGGTMMVCVSRAARERLVLEV
ncbi:Ferredoxin-NADP reductase [Haloechinothrix alba]|uniref:Ferredoxin-NADP reductase n=1 Tax=Haloechinothrix alba TaxID=664784 RepID=A0A238X2P0_9PSEU|nr:PDR/VanB family oxidoreductase [Haloechinothrix alba]SNR53235.1 Ferredoxin-NADP reductase [Haloechinothrix alba]